MTRTILLLTTLCLTLSVGCGGDNKPGSTGSGATVPFGDATISGGDTVDDVASSADVFTVGQDVQDAGGSNQSAKCETPGTWGCPCKSNDDCDSNFCIEDDSGLVCTKSCTDSCPQDWKCALASGSDAIFICLPQFTSLCRPCAAHVDCGAAGQTVGSAKCIPLDMGGGFVNGSFCGAGCDEVNTCPSGYTCKDVTLPGEAKVGQCKPEKNECTCSQQEIKLALSTACQRKNEFGTCVGARKCSPEGLTLCDAAVPSAEVCDGVDNDCDGDTDEEDAVGCKVYFVDNDGDGAGIGDGKCLCNNPGPGFAAAGGDCNDIAKTINPGAKEVCNDIDDNCNSTTDEPGASGCSVYYKDKDGDSFGDPDDAACVCPSKKPADLIEQAGDCDDGNDKVKPGATEICNSVDDNCNGATDEEDAQGCKLHYIDIDKDLYGPTDKSKCLCAPNALYTAIKPGDCNDNNAKIKPTQLEICNNIDDDCNGKTDDGDAPKSCPKVVGIEAACTAGKCGIASCPSGYFDVDGDFKNGCECLADKNYGLGGGSCKAAIDMGKIGDQQGQGIQYQGNLMPGEVGDWFVFEALDNVDDKGCDTFHVRVRLKQNPGNIFRLDLYRGSCAGASQLCVNETDTSWGVNFSGMPPFGVHTAKAVSQGNVTKSPNPEVGGECKCSTKVGKSGPGAPGMNQCTNNTAKFYVRVHLAKGQKASCANYQLDVTNGNYKTTK